MKKSPPNGKSVSRAKLPRKLRSGAKDNFIGRLHGIMRIVGDIESPSADWEFCLREDDPDGFDGSSDVRDGDAVDSPKSAV
jgi:hypothetical protein